MSPRIAVHWSWVTEVALLARLAPPADHELATAAAAARALRDRVAELTADEPSPPELVVGLESLLVRFAQPPDERSTAVGARIAALVATRSITPAREAPDDPREHRFEVSYGGEDGPDLPLLARELGLREAEVVARHAGTLYTVGLVGFSPGFGYLLGLPRELERPRLASPRPRVPAGSVAIAGPFSAVYPRATPGGWRLLGRTEATLFDPAAVPPARLAAGDRVRFVPR